jgi:MFS transporter, ACS family, aldohexuronate transporter
MAPDSTKAGKTGSPGGGGSQPAPAFRWTAILIITLSSFLNYLDRQILPAMAPVLQGEFDLTNTDYGWILSAFSIAYALSALLVGWMIDRVGLSLGVCLAVAFWSLAGAGTGMVAGFAGLIVMRSLLGVGQAGGVPASSKGIAQFLPPKERALGMATTQIGLSAGAIAAPLVAVWLGGAYGWRVPFVVTGLLGLLWIPLWLLVARRAPTPAEPVARQLSVSALLSDRRLWGLIIGSVLYMTLYSLWSNWTTIYLVEERQLAQDAANRTLAWIPPIFANLGGLFGGWLAWRWIRGGMPVLQARMKVNRWSALVLLTTATIPFMPTTGIATVMLCLSFFWVTAMSVNVYAMPLDIFGVKRAALAVSTLTGSYGAMQAGLSPIIGALVDNYGFTPVCIGGSMLPLAAVFVMEELTMREPD